MTELSDELYAKIQELCVQGDKLSDQSKWNDALDTYWEAFDMLPEPVERWEASTWILSAIGDANFLSENFRAGRDNLSNAMRCPDALGNPFIHLRLGQCQFELGNLDRAADELARAFMGEGKDIFKDEDSKYFEFLKTKLEDIN